MLTALLAAALAAAPVPERVLPAELRVEHLPNGLTVVLARFPAHGVVAFDTLVRAGSREEVPPAPTGVAHLLEHLLFRGSATVPAGALEQRMQILGVDANAETDADATLLADLAPSESLPELIDLEADRIQHLLIDDAAVESEAGAIRSEAQARSADPSARLDAAVDAAAFPAHPYGHPVIGTDADLAHLHEMARAARELYRRAYRPDATVLVLAGDFEPERALARIRRAYGRWGGRAELAPQGSALPPAERRRLAEPGAERPEAAIAFRAAPAADARDAATALLLAELLGGPRSLLHAHLVQERELAERVDVQAVRRRDAQLLVFRMGAPGGGALDALEGALESELRALRSGKIDPTEVEAVRAALLNRAVVRFQSPGALARALALEAATGGPPSALAELYRALGKVDAADVLAWARRNLVPDRRVSVLLGEGAAAR